MTLSDKQADHNARVAVIIAFCAAYRGPTGERYRMRRGIGSWSYRDEEANRSVGGHPRSTHLHALADDFVVDRWDAGRAEWQLCSGSELTAVLSDLHTVWEMMGGARRIIGDLGHFSAEHLGVR